MKEISKESIDQVVLFINNSELHKAKKKINEYLKVNPQLDVLHNLHGTILLKQEKFGKSIDVLKTALSINPNFVSAMQNLGIAYQKLGYYDESLKCFEDAINLKPELSSAHNNKGSILIRQRNDLGAITCLKKALELDSNNADAYFNLGVIHQSQKNYSEAILFYKKATGLDNNFVAAYFTMGETYRLLNNYKEALDCYIRSRHRKTNARILECLLVLGMKDEYTKQIKKISKKDPYNTWVAAVNSFLSQQFRIKNYHPFCPDPLELLYQTNLIKYFEDFDKFSQELYDEMIQQKFVWAPYGKTEVNGYSTMENLSDLKLPKLSVLEKMILKEINLYRKHHKNKRCDLIRKWPKRFKLYIWCVRLQKEGYNENHIHPSGWLSGVFYLKIPTKIKDKEGGLECSLHGENFKIVRNYVPTKFFPPKVGNLTLFPSSLYHKTIPFHSEEERVAIAFDVIRHNNEVWKAEQFGD